VTNNRTEHNTDGIIHKLVTVFAGSLLSPGILPTVVPGYAQLHVRQFCNRDKFLLSIEVCEPGAAPLLSTRFKTGDKFVIHLNCTAKRIMLTKFVREGKNRAVHSLPTAFIKLREESERSCNGLWSLSNVYELYRRTVCSR
jgi:hypothetical protein